MNQYVTGFNPSFDFQLFQLPNFGELYANEFGVASRFNSNYPTQYVQDSLNTLLSLVQPQPYPNSLFIPFQNPSGRDIPAGRSVTPSEFERAMRDEEYMKLRQKEYEKNKGISLRGILGLPPISDDTPTLCNDCSPEQEDELRRKGTVTSDSKTNDLFSNTPFGKITKEMGYLFIGVIILILLLLFVRK